MSESPTSRPAHRRSARIALVAFAVVLGWPQRAPATLVSSDSRHQTIAGDDARLAACPRASRSSKPKEWKPKEWRNTGWKNTSWKDNEWKDNGWDENAGWKSKDWKSNDWKPKEWQPKAR